MSVSKVVKVEEVDGPLRDDSRPSLQSGALVPTGNISKARTDSSVLPVFEDSDMSLVPTAEEDAEALETEDKVYALPSNWPKLPEIFRRRSCQLTKAMSPCINKAVSHLELLQNIIEDHFKDTETKSRQSSAKPVLQMATRAGSKKELRFSEMPASKRLSVSAASRTSVRSDAGTESSLSILGVGLKGDEKDEQELEVPYLGAADVVEEVVTLLARLENDRQETDAALDFEKLRVEKLKQKIDGWCLKRMTLLPEVVQKEHEECIMDLNELQWHVAYSTRNESRIKERVEIAEVLYARLKEDIAFVKRHIPLVEEKLELELEAMDKIRGAQTDTDVELDTTKVRQEKTTAKSHEALEKAETERGHIKHELDFVRDALNIINEELADAKMTYNAYVHQINETEQQLFDNEQELKVLEVKNENSKVAEQMQCYKVHDVQAKISAADYDNQRCETENRQLQKHLLEKREKYTEILSSLETKIKRKDNILRKTLLRNQETDMEVEDLMEKIDLCKGQKVKDEKNVSRIHKEMQKIAQQYAVTNEEYSRVAAINQTILEELQLEQEKTFKLEESLKITAETLRRQVKEEIHNKTTLAARISSDKDEFVKTRVTVQDRKVKAKKVAEDILESVHTVRTKVEKLRSVKEEKIKQKGELTSQRQETQKQKVESVKRFNDKLEQIEPHHAHLKADLLAVSRRLDHIEWKEDMMREKMNDMDKSKGMMERLVRNTAAALVTLTDEQEEVNLQVEAQQKIGETLSAAHTDILARIRSSEASHRTYMDARKMVQRDLETDKESNLKRNTELASLYRTLQNHYMVIKEKLMDHFEERVKVEIAIKDFRQLQALQVRMHGAMQEYYKYRGLYNAAELARMEGQSNSNGVKVAELQENMDYALQHIAEFIQKQMSHESVKKTAWAAIEKQEAKAKAKAMATASVPSKTSQARVEVQAVA